MIPLQTGPKIEIQMFEPEKGQGAQPVRILTAGEHCDLTPVRGHAVNQASSPSGGHVISLMNKCRATSKFRRRKAVQSTARD